MTVLPKTWSPYLYLGILLAIAAAVVYFISESVIGPKEVGTAFLASVGTFIGAHHSIESLRMRNDFYVNEVQPVIAKSGFNGRRVLAGEFQVTLGERLFLGAINGASAMFGHITESSKSLLAMHAELYEAAKKIYPDAEFIKPAPEA